MLTTARRIARLPMLLVDAVQSTSDTARQLPVLQRAVIDGLGSLDRSLRHVLALLPNVAGDIERMRETIEPQHERVIAIERGLATLPAIVDELQRMRHAIEPRLEHVGAIEASVAGLESRLADLQDVLGALRRTVGDAAEHLPDPDAPGPLARARDTLVGRS